MTASVLRHGGVFRSRTPLILGGQFDPVSEIVRRRLRWKSQGKTAVPEGGSGVFKRIKRDIQVVFERDPAVKSGLEVILCYPGFHAVLLHRLNHYFYQKGFFVLARFLSQVVRFLTGIEIHPGAKIGEGLFIDHGMGVVIGETAEVGDNCTLFQGVTLGGTGKEKGKRHPTLENNVMVSTGARVLGNITIGDNCKIGAGAVVVKSVPANCTVVGVPGRIVVRDGRRVSSDMDQVNLPDPVAEMLFCLQRDLTNMERRVRELEEKLAERGPVRPANPAAGQNEQLPAGQSQIERKESA